MIRSSDHDPRTSPLGALLRGVRAHDEALAANAPVEARTPEPAGPQLFTATTPDPRESLRSLVYRACAANGVPTTYGIMQHLGQVHRNRFLVAGDSEFDAARIAHAIRTTASEVESRTYPLLPRRRLSFFGLEVSSTMIETRARRFSPTGLTKAEVHRPLWELRALPFCLDKWDMLQDTCPCHGEHGVLQGWTRSRTSIGRCDRCGEPLWELEPIPVPRHMREDLEVLTAMAHPSPERRTESLALLPEQLQGADRSKLWRIVHRVALAIDPDCGQIPIDEPERHLSGLHRACRAICAWPHGLDAIQPHETLAPRGWTAIVSEFAGFAPRAPRGPSVSRTAKPDSQPKVVGIRPATEIARIKDDNLHLIWEAGLVTQHTRQHGPRRLVAFDPQELVAIAPLWRARVLPDTAAYELGICLSGVEQLLAMGRLDPAFLRLADDEVVLDRESIDALVARLSETAEDGVGTILLRTALHHVSCRPKPWAPLLAALADGDIPFSLKDGGRTIAGRIMVRPQDIRRIAAMPSTPIEHPTFALSTTMPQHDALVLLNAWQDQAAILDGVASEGTNPKFYTVADVLARSRTIASLGEISEVARIPWMEVGPRLEREYGLRRTGFQVWSRTALIEKGLLPPLAD